MQYPWSAEPGPEKINDNIVVCWDADSDPTDRKQWEVLLTTSLKDAHWHWDMTREEAVKLHAWLDRFLKETNIEG